MITERPSCFSDHPPESPYLPIGRLEPKREDLNQCPLTHTLPFRAHHLQPSLLYWLLPSALKHAQISRLKMPLLRYWAPTVPLSLSFIDQSPRKLVYILLISTSWARLLNLLQSGFHPHQFPQLSWRLSITSVLLNPADISYLFSVSNQLNLLLHFPHLETLFTQGSHDTKLMVLSH